MLVSRQYRSGVQYSLNVAVVITTIVSCNNWCVLTTLVVFLIQLNLNAYVYRGQGSEAETSEDEKWMWTYMAFLVWNVVKAQDVLITLATLHVVAMNLWVEKLFCCPDSTLCR